jgi:hypothetical protein
MASRGCPYPYQNVGQPTWARFWPTTSLGSLKEQPSRALAGKYGLATDYFGATHPGSRAWRQGRNAIVITWDEDDFSDQGLPGTGCCGADPGGGHVVTIVITNKARPSAGRCAPAAQRRTPVPRWRPW